MVYNIVEVGEVWLCLMIVEEKKVIIVLLVGMIFEWYDFYFYGLLVVIIGVQFFIVFFEVICNVFVLLVFVVGFIVWFFGVLVFGLLGDLVGWKYIFFVIILIMGILIFLVGLLLGYVSWGVVVLIILIVLWMFQGLVLGGEYGGVVVYVVEYVFVNCRGFYIVFIQIMVMLGLLLLLIVILIVQGYVNGNYLMVGVVDLQGNLVFGVDGQQIMILVFNSWGWCILFLGLIFLLLILLYICLQMEEFFVFKKMKEEGCILKVFMCEVFGNWKNGKIVLIVLFGLIVG